MEGWIRGPYDAMRDSISTPSSVGALVVELSSLCDSVSTSADDRRQNRDLRAGENAHLLRSHL